MSPKESAPQQATAHLADLLDDEVEKLFGVELLSSGKTIREPKVVPLFGRFFQLTQSISSLSTH
jgi:hypothetical protein